MKFGLGLSVQHLPDESQAARFQEHVEQVRLACAVGFGLSLLSRRTIGFSL